MNTIFDTSKLCSRILEQYLSLEDFSNEVNVGIDKLNGIDEFTWEDIISIRAALRLTDEETTDIFFPEYVQEHQSATIEALSTERIIRRLERIEEGLNALDMMTSGGIMSVGESIANEEFLHAFRFIMEPLLERVTDLRADLTHKLGLLLNH